MTREEALEILNGYKLWIAKECELREALDMAIESLLADAEQVTSKLNNPCDSLLTEESNGSKEHKSKLDLISRADAIETVCGVVIDEFDISPTKGYEVAEKALSALPSADAEPIAVLSTDKEIPKITEALDMAIEALQEQPTIPMFTESEEAYKAWTWEEMGKTHGRLIDADKLKKQLDTVYNEMANERERKGLRLARWFLISAPTVSADRPHGEWEKRETVGSVDFAYCSECKQPIIHGHTSPLWNFCPNCGAKMGGDGE